MTFAQVFFKYYDRAIGNGVCSFSQTGIRANDFITICTDPSFVLDRESVMRASRAMKLREEEIKELLVFVEEAERDA
ncbi:MAG: hypothetical protein II035_00480 [Firmicutes bacterium]|nr:hypothetical protein [Bacillota bacterium]MBQ1714812.1 hypothetical protein [Bacillota bacterium]